MHDRKRSLGVLAIPVLILLLLALVCLAPSCRKAGVDQRPNIIFLLTDDQRFDALGAMGNPVLRTPHLDRLAQEGILFTNAFVTTSICCTSRASILSGQYARRHGINDFVSSFSEEAWAESYPFLLGEAGYQTGFIGKFGVGREEDMPSATFDYWKGFGGQGRYETVDEAGDSIHLTRLMGRQAVEFLQGADTVDAPFCLSLSFKAPHCQDGDPRQFITEEAHRHILEGVHIPEEPLNRDEYYALFSEGFRERNEARVRWELRFSTPEKYQTMVRNYYRLIYGIDEVVGQIREELSALGLDDNTIIIFTSDNGYYLGEYGLAGKWYGHEESIRVPMVIYDPQHKAAPHTARRADQCVLNIDVAPTILDMAGVDIPEGMQGSSLSHIVAGSHEQLRDEFFYEHQFIRVTREPNTYIPGVEGVVTGDSKYMHYLDGSDSLVYEELFDRSAANELHNLIDEAAYKDVLAEMKEKVKQYKEDLK